MTDQTMRLSLLIDANAAKARGEVTGLTGDITGLKTATDAATKSSTAGAAGVGTIGDKAGASEAQIAALNAELAVLRERLEAASASEAQAASQMGGLIAKVNQLEAAIGRGGRGGAGGSGAAGSLGNLVANFNDVGVMMMAGQNPLTLAIQQGTQISQVIGPMGAAGAVRALGGAFIGMLNPVSLITIGVIGFGAAAVQWLTGAGEKAQSFEDNLGDLDEVLSRIESFDFSDTFSEPLADATAINEKWANTLELIRQAQGAQLQAALADTMSGLGLEASIREAERLAAIRARTGATSYGGEGPGDIPFNSLGFDNINEAAQAVQLLRGITGDTREEIAASLEKTIEWLRACGLLTDELGMQLALMAEQLGLQRVIADEARAAAETPADRSPQDWDEAADAGRNEGRVTMMREVVELEAQAAAAARTRAQTDAATAQAMQIAMGNTSNLAALTLRYGADSAEVAAERARQERAVFEATLATLNVTDDVKNQLRVAYDTMVLMEGADISAGIAAAVGPAQALAQQLGISLGLAYQLAQMGAPAVLDPRDPRYDEGAALRATNFGFEYSRVSPFAASRTDTGAAGGAAGGGGPTQAERDAAKDLIQSLQDEIAILQELDPVQQEMLRHRQDLALATTEERAEIETLIATRIREEAAAESQREIWDTLRQTSFDVIKGLEDRGRSAINVMRNLGVTILEVVQKGLLLGEGPLGALLGGGSDSGGLLGMAATAILGSITGKATGGMISGPGTGTSDDVLMWGSNGEFVVTAQATQQYRPVLEAMNAGAPIPAFARGGAVGGGGGSSSSSGSGGGSSDRRTLHATFNLEGARGDREIEEAAYRGMQRFMEEYDREVLPVRMRDLSSDWRTG